MLTNDQCVQVAEKVWGWTRIKLDPPNYAEEWWRDTEYTKMLIIGKCPAPLSVEKGHYFQGRQGRMFWNRLKEHAILQVPPRQFEDDFLIEHGYGITDIVKKPRDFGEELTDEDYKIGTDRITRIIANLKPMFLLFV